MRTLLRDKHPLRKPSEVLALSIQRCRVLVSGEVAFFDIFLGFDIPALGKG